MHTVDSYLQHAEECDKLARSAQSPEQRKMIEDMANTWRMLANQRQRRIELELANIAG
jgi:hypothetical protein